MARKYPRIGTTVRHRSKKKKRFNCFVCEKIIFSGDFMRVDIQMNHMRGDDDVYSICMPCWEEVKHNRNKVLVAYQELVDQAIAKREAEIRNQESFKKSIEKSERRDPNNSFWYK